MWICYLFIFYRFLSNFTKTVVVTINYRLGALGFLYLKETAINGNVGLKDQRLSFEWVSKYIPCFGGDVFSINLFGQSAGAMSIGAHLVSSLSKNLFNSAIIQSNPWPISFNSIKDATTIGEHFLNVSYLIINFIFVLCSLYLCST